MEHKFSKLHTRSYFAEVILVHCFYIIILYWSLFTHIFFQLCLQKYIDSLCCSGNIVSTYGLKLDFEIMSYIVYECICVSLTKEASLCDRWKVPVADGILEEVVNLQFGLITVCGTHWISISLTINCLSNVPISSIPEDSLLMNEHPFHPFHLTFQSVFLLGRTSSLKIYILKHVKQDWT